MLKIQVDNGVITKSLRITVFIVSFSFILPRKEKILDASKELSEPREDH